MIGHITLIIAHNHHIFQAILHNILQSYVGICVLAKVDTAAELLKKTKELAPDVVLAGLGLPGVADIDAWQKLVAHCGKTKVVLSWHHDDADKIQEMMRASCAGYIARNASPNFLSVMLKTHGEHVSALLYSRNRRASHRVGRTTR